MQILSRSPLVTCPVIIESMALSHFLTFHLANLKPFSHYALDISAVLLILHAEERAKVNLIEKSNTLDVLI